MNRRAFFAALAGAPVAMAAAVASDGLTPNEYLDQVAEDIRQQQEWLGTAVRQVQANFSETIEAALGPVGTISQQIAEVQNGLTRMVRP